MARLGILAIIVVASESAVHLRVSLVSAAPATAATAVIEAMSRRCSPVPKMPSGTPHTTAEATAGSPAAMVGILRSLRTAMQGPKPNSTSRIAWRLVAISRTATARGQMIPNVLSARWSVPCAFGGRRLGRFVRRRSVAGTPEAVDHGSAHRHHESSGTAESASLGSPVHHAGGIGAGRWFSR